MKFRIFCIPFVLNLLLPLLFLGCVNIDTPALFDTNALYQETPTPIEPLAASQIIQPPLSEVKTLQSSAPILLELTVEQAIELALQNNRALKIEKINPMIAGTFESIERGVYDPEIFGELQYSREESSEANQAGVRTAEEKEEHNAIVGLRQKLPTGTTVEASVSQESTATNSDPREQNVRMGLSVTQSLLRGLGPMVNLVNVRKAELSAEISSYELRGVTEALLTETEIAYWSYVLADRKIGIFENSLTIARQQLNDIEQRIEVGTLPRIEAAAAHAEVARREQALINVRSTLEICRLRLLQLINPAQQETFAYKIKAKSTAEINPDPITDLDIRLQLAAKSRPDLNEAQLRLKQNRLETIMTRNGLLPRLDLFITLGKSGYANSFADAVKDIDASNHDFGIGIKLSQYLNNRQATARDLAARASWRQTVEAVENLKQLVDLDVRLAVNEFERSRQQIAATRATRLFQEETLKAEKERFDVGASTALLVAQAQRDLLASEVDEVEAIINCRQALVNLYLAEGSLLERRGIKLTSDSW